MKIGKIFSAAVLAAALLVVPALAWEATPVDMSQVQVDNGASSWAKSELQAAYEAGLVVDLNGNPGFQDTIDRLQFAQLAVNLVEVLNGEAIAPAAADTFSDCDHEAVLKAYAAGIVQGVGDGLFDPSGKLTREQLATMLYRAWGTLGDQTPSAGLAGYTDAANVSSWAADAVGSLAASGIMKGTSDTTLTPQGPCTIEQSILLVYRLYQQVAK